MAERVGYAQLDHLLGEKTQAPLASAVGGLRAGQPDEFRFLLTVEPALVLACRSLAFDATGEAPLREALSNASNCASGYFQRLGNARVRLGRAALSLVNFEQDANAGLLRGRALAWAESFEQVRALLFGELDAVLFVRHEIRRWKFEETVMCNLPHVTHKFMVDGAVGAARAGMNGTDLLG